MAAALIGLAGDIKQGALELGGFTKEMQAFEAASKTANLDKLVHPQTLEIAKQTASSLKQQVEEKDRLIQSLNKEDNLSRLIYGYAQVQNKAAEERLKLGEQLRQVTEAQGVLELQQAARLAALAGQVGSARARGPFQGSRRT
jgi:hypothetical protein